MQLRPLFLDGYFGTEGKVHLAEPLLRLDKSSARGKFLIRYA